jgi:hypothetical protein
MMDKHSSVKIIQKEQQQLKEKEKVLIRRSVMITKQLSEDPNFLEKAGMGCDIERERKERRRNRKP